MIDLYLAFAAIICLMFKLALINPCYGLHVGVTRWKTISAAFFTSCNAFIYSFNI